MQYLAEYSPEQCEHIIKSLCTNLQIFVQSTSCTSVVLGLSGGMDSAFVLALAIEALGKDSVNPLFLPSRYTTQESYDIIEELSITLGISIPTIPIDSLIDSFNSVFEAGIGITLEGIALENIQARLRGNILMSYANMYNSLLLATSNKSELAVGFCTLYGDTCGAIAPLANIYKTHVYMLARHYSTVHCALPELLFTRSPSAELAYNQKDTDSLPEYPILDVILHGIEMNTVNVLLEEGFSSKTIHDVVELKEKALFKTLQYPPALFFEELGVF